VCILPFNIVNLFLEWSNIGIRRISRCMAGGAKDLK